MATSGITGALESLPVFARDALAYSVGDSIKSRKISLDPMTMVQVSAVSWVYDNFVSKQVPVNLVGSMDPKITRSIGLAATAWAGNMVLPGPRKVDPITLGVSVGIKDVVVKPSF